MKEVQKLLKPQDSRLKRLGPGNARRTIILFVVPHILGKTLKDQEIKGELVEHWYKKTAQFVLALSEEVFHAQTSNATQ